MSSNYNDIIDHDEDITQNIMETLSAALLINPKFNFGKLMELSEEINGTKNKELLSDIITLSFLKYLEMDDAAAILSSENIVADSAYKAMHLDEEHTMKWFVRFLAVMNPSLLASISLTLTKVVNGIMIKNTRSTDADRLARTKTKLDKLVSSGDIEKRIEDISDKKPTETRKKHKETASVGLLGWLAGMDNTKKTVSKKSKDVKKRKTSSSESSTSADKLKEVEKSDISSTSSKKLSEALSEMRLTEEEILPEESASNLSINKEKIKPRKSAMKVAVLSASAKKVSLREDDSIISG